MFFFKKYELEDNLWVARRFLENNLEGFPDRKCHLAAEFLKRTKGYDVIVGIYVPKGIILHSGSLSEYSPDVALCAGHAWIYSVKDDCYGDISFDQFTKNDEDKVKIFKKNTRQLKPLNDGWLYHMMHLNESRFMITLNYLVEKFEKENNKI